MRWHFVASCVQLQVPPCCVQVSAGEPLLLSYGKLSNDFLLMDYGFVVAANPHDAVQLRFDVGLMQVGGLGESAEGVAH